MTHKIFQSLTVAFCLLTFFISSFAHAQQEGIAAVVNEDAITMSDLNDRINLVAISSGLGNSAEMRSKLAPQVVTALIEEQLKLQEAARLKIEVTPQEVDEGFATIAQQNNIPPEKFREMLQSSGINIMTMERQIRSQIGWSKMIQQEMRPDVNISDTDIDNELARLNKLKGMNEYLLAEVFLPVDDPKNEADTRALASRLVSEIRGGKASFFKAAQQFSKAAGATQGGDRGWIQQGQMQPELEAAVKGLQKESVSDPVRSTTGYHILFLRDTRQMTDATIPSRDQIISNLGIERLERMQKRYLLDLRSAAFIENRVASGA
jgi:peptidyl-prolyl cis-trans isomerase SurA